ncbi:TIGR03089 family protein [Aquipuribacter sp. MA13-6]|uniref:TIGR03089 family protein n=1 Tax=unclassified Aquipuribacter TaxID=2635084 RepID=UPI003EF02416
MQIATGPPAPAHGPADVDVARLVRTLQQDPRPRLTWYGGDDARVELTGSGLAQWVAKTAHLLGEEADVEPGSTVQVLLGPDWRAPVFWLATWFLGAQVGPDAAAASDAGRDRPDVVVVPEGSTAPAAGVAVVVAAAALPRPVAELPPGAVDYGAEVSGFPDRLPSPGPATVLRLRLGATGRTLLGPGATPTQVATVWASGGSVVLHTGLAASALERVREQENVDRTDVDQG